METESILLNKNLLLTRLYINQLLRFMLDAPPSFEKAQILQLDPTFQTLAGNSSGFELIQTSIASFLKEENESLQKAKEDFNYLFIGPNALPAPPWESVYVGKEHLLFEETTLEVRRFYKAHGLSFIYENSQAEDHIVVELEFLAYLFQEALKAEDVNALWKIYADQCSFLEAHFLKWTPNFAALLEPNARTDWFRGASLLLKDYIELEQEMAAHIKEVLNHE